MSGSPAEPKSNLKTVGVPSVDNYLGKRKAANEVDKVERDRKKGKFVPDETAHEERHEFDKNCPWNEHDPAIKELIDKRHSGMEDVSASVYAHVDKKKGTEALLPIVNAFNRFKEGEVIDLTKEIETIEK